MTASILARHYCIRSKTWSRLKAILIIKKSSPRTTRRFVHIGEIQKVQPCNLSRSVLTQPHFCDPRRKQKRRYFRALRRTLAPLSSPRSTRPCAQAAAAASKSRRPPPIPPPMREHRAPGRFQRFFFLRLSKFWDHDFLKRPAAKHRVKSTRHDDDAVENVMSR